MTRRAIVWRVVIALFIAVNLAGTVFAAVKGELIHASVHTGLIVLGAVVAARLRPGRAPSY